MRKDGMEKPWLDSALTPRNAEVQDVGRFSGMAGQFDSRTPTWESAGAMTN